jgi:hypothetical protein
MPLEQFCAQFMLDILHPPVQRGGGDEKAFGGLAYRALAGDLFYVTEYLKVLE